MFRPAVCIALVLLSSAIRVSAQSDTPIISGGIQYGSTTSGGATVFQPIISPVVAIPIGQHFLIERVR